MARPLGRDAAKLAPDPDPGRGPGAAEAVDLTGLSLEQLMQLRVALPGEREPPGDRGAGPMAAVPLTADPPGASKAGAGGDGSGADGALPSDLTGLDLAQLLALSLSGDDLAEAQQTVAIAPASAAQPQAPDGQPTAPEIARSGGASSAIHGLLLGSVGPFGPAGDASSNFDLGGGALALAASGVLAGSPALAAAFPALGASGSDPGAAGQPAGGGPTPPGNSVSPPNAVTGPGFHAGTDGINAITGTSLSEGRGGEEILYGAAGDDLLIGNGNEDRLLGGTGNDSLFGGAGGDILIGGPGNDLGDGGGQGDVYLFQQGSGIDSFSGGAGQDGILLVAVGGGAPALADWSLVLTAGSASWSASQVALSAGATGRVVFTDGSEIAFDGVETISWSASYSIDGGNSLVRIAGAGGGLLSGGGQEDTLFGGGGDDLLQGGGNEDLLLGGAGNDSLIGGSQNDMLLGGSGSDLLDGGGGNDLLDGGSGADSLFGGAGNDTLIWDFSDLLVDGGGGTDSLQIDGNGLNLLTFGPVLQSIEVIDFEADAANNSLTLDAASLLGVSGSGTLTVFGDAGDSVDAGSGWTDGGIVGGFHIYSQAGASLRLDLDLAVNPDIAA